MLRRTLGWASLKKAPEALSPLRSCLELLSEVSRSGPAPGMSVPEPHSPHPSPGLPILPLRPAVAGSTPAAPRDAQAGMSWKFLFSVLHFSFSKPLGWLCLRLLLHGCICVSPPGHWGWRSLIVLWTPGTRHWVKSPQLIADSLNKSIDVVINYWYIKEKGEQGN